MIPSGMDHGSGKSENSGLFGPALEWLAEADPALAPVIAAAGPLPERAGRPGFEGLASVIVSQLVSRRSAEAIWLRLSEALGPLTAEAFLKAGGGIGPRLGLTAAKADTLYRIAQMVCEGGLDLESLHALPAQEAISRLTALKGVGVWTAEVHLLFNGNHPDIFPSGDLALRAAFAHGLGDAGSGLLPERPSEAALRLHAARWAPHRSTAARLLWAYYGRVVSPGPAQLP